MPHYRSEGTQQGSGGIFGVCMPLSAQSMSVCVCLSFVN